MEHPNLPINRRQPCDMQVLRDKFANPLLEAHRFLSTGIYCDCSGTKEVLWLLYLQMVLTPSLCLCLCHAFFIMFPIPFYC